jgi:dienelactone hydrolase
MKNKLTFLSCLLLNLSIGQGSEQLLQQGEEDKGCESGASTPLMEKDGMLSDAGLSLAEQRKALGGSSSSSVIPTTQPTEKLTYDDAYGRLQSVPIMDSLATLARPDKEEGIGFAFRRPTFPASTRFVEELMAVADRSYLDGPHAAVAARLFMPVLTADHTKKIPVIICACDSFGFRKDDRDLALRFMEAGFASLWIDSETSNNNKKVADNQMGASLIGNVAEMYYAFKLAKTHPHLDPDNVLAYGSSRGGVIVELCRRHDLSLHFGRGCSFKGFYAVSGLPIIQPNDWALSRALVSEPAYYYHGTQDNWNSRQAQYNWYKRQADQELNVSLREFPGGHCFDRNVEPRRKNNVVTLNQHVVVMHAELMDFQNLPARITALEKRRKDNERETDEEQPQRRADEEILGQIPGYTIIGEQPYPGDETAPVRSWLTFAQDFSRLSRGADVKPNAISRERFLKNLISDMRDSLN